MKAPTSKPNYSRVYCLYHNERECEIEISEPKWAQKEAFRFALRPKEQIIFFNDYYDLSLSKNELRNRAKEYATEWHKEACERVEKTQNLLRRLGIS